MKQFRDLTPEAIEALGTHLLEECASWLHDAGVVGAEHIPDAVLGQRIRVVLRTEHAVARRSSSPIRPIRGRGDGN
jgi:hypothetical protein